MHEKEKKIFLSPVLLSGLRSFTSRETPRLHNNCNIGQNMNPEI